tara:strand:+ start:2762 stop:3550 length:789 start_codon:yes stop_codon:yes gene_type:complete
VYIPINELIKGSRNEDSLILLLNQAEEAFKSRINQWSGFVSAPIKAELIERVSKLDELNCYSDGGYPNAERQRICFSRVSGQINKRKSPAPLKGLNIEGNFLFDRAEILDFRNILEVLGTSSCEIGDIWLLGDRGAQVVSTPEAALHIDGRITKVRNIPIKFESVEINELNLPLNRVPKVIKTVEASKRLDAIASAGFGLSRQKIINQIKLGRLRLNWMPIRQASRAVSKGDQIQLESKGSIEILNLEQTNRGRWRVELLRQ